MSNPKSVSTRRTALAAAFALASGTAFAADPYVIDANHTQVIFSYTHQGLSHISGRLNQVEGDFLFDAKDPTQSRIQVNIPVSSITVGVPALDKELVGEGFFDTAKFPLATFQSTSVTNTGPDKLAVAGDLTIRGVTKPVTLDVTINGIKPNAVGFDATATIKRSDFGVTKFAQFVNDDIVLHITMEAHAPKPQAK